jgi:hypothetical protein
MAMSACCVMIDLDGFKAINDRHGHLVGDAALVHFAATLRRHMRPADTIARLGGDEFALILMNCSGDDACLLLERLQQALAGSPCQCRVAPCRCGSLPGSPSFMRLNRWGRCWSVPMPPCSMQSNWARRWSACVPPARSAQAATASACDRQTASACVPSAIDERESDG